MGIAFYLGDFPLLAVSDTWLSDNSIHFVYGKWFVLNVHQSFWRWKNSQPLIFKDQIAPKQFFLSMFIMQVPFHDSRMLIKHPAGCFSYSHQWSCPYESVPILTSETGSVFGDTGDMKLRVLSMEPRCIVSAGEAQVGFPQSCVCVCTKNFPCCVLQTKEKQGSLVRCEVPALQESEHPQWLH